MKKFSGVALALSLLASFFLVQGTAQAKAPAFRTTTLIYKAPGAFDPKKAAVNGSTDVYHCTLIDPHVISDRLITSSQLMVDKAKEVHHAIYFLVNPADVPTATALNQGGNGWTCFGNPLNPSGAFGGTTWLGAWAPGRGVTYAPTGTAIPFPAHSMIVMQIHYNLLHGSKPDRTAVRLTTTAGPNPSLKPMAIVQFPAPPDLPCAEGVTGPLCDRAASLADLGARFGPSAVSFVKGLEQFCHHDWAHPETVGRLVSTSCTVPLPANVVIRQVTPHMHLLGQSASVTVTRASTTIPLMAVKSYNFDYQKSYTVAGSGFTTQAGDQLTVRCTYNPWLRPRLAETKNLTPRYVTWGDGSSDEMCLAVLAVTRG